MFEETRPSHIPWDNCLPRAKRLHPGSDQMGLSQMGVCHYAIGLVREAQQEANKRGKFGVKREDAAANGRK